MTDPDYLGQIPASGETENQELDGSDPYPAIATGADVAVAAVKREVGGADVAEGSEDEDEEEEANPSELGERSWEEVEGSGKEVEDKDGDVEVAVEVSRREGGEGSKGPPCQGVIEAVRVMVRPVSGEKKYAVQRSSCFHGVTRLKWSGKFEAHLWDNTSRMEGRKRKGKHVYLGTYDSEEEAARAHDLAALKYWGPTLNAKLNFPITNYEKDLETMKTMTQEEYVAHVRRKNSSFSRGSSSYRGVTRRRKGGKWQARIGRVGDKTDAKDIYLGTYDTEEEAAEAYDLAAIQLRGAHAVTNFDISNYYDEGLVPIEGACKRLAM